MTLGSPYTMILGTESTWRTEPLPRRLHRCSAVSQAVFSGFTLVERCACGAIRNQHPLDRPARWRERNSRRATVVAPPSGRV